MPEERFRAIFEGALDPMFLADDDARYLDANPAACAFFGLSRDEICTRRVVDFAPEKARMEFAAVWKLFLVEGEQRGEYVLEMPDGRVCEVEFSATANVNPGQHLSIIRDVSDRKRLDAKRERLIDVANDLARAANDLARIDTLTGIPNRRVWNDRIVGELQRAKRSEEPLTVAVVDLDGLKVLNDTRGHAAGDELLQTFATVCQKQLRDIDLLARVGGDEFWLLFPVCPQGLEHVVLERMRAALPAGQAFSAGTATWDRSESASELVERADRALYQDKLRRRIGAASPTRSSPAS